MELVIAAGALAMSALFFVLAGRFPELAADPGGLTLFPRIVAVLTGAASAAFLFQSLLPRTAARQENGSAITSPVAWLRDRRLEVITFTLVGLLPFSIQWFGFIAAVCIFTALILMTSRVRWLPMLLTTLLTTAGIYIAYAIVLGAVLPVGRLWN